MLNFWDFSAWGGINLFMVLLVSLLGANMIKRSIAFLRISLIPSSVLGGGILVLIEAIFRWLTGKALFDTAFFGGNGTANLELITYHMLALGFIGSSFKTSAGKLTKQRTTEIFNTGMTTVATYLLQAILGFGISLIASTVVSGFFGSAGILLPFGFGQGTGQAMNYGTIYETDYGFIGGKSFGLTIAALGFLSASLGGVVHLNLLRKKGIIKADVTQETAVTSEQIQGKNDIPMQESMDKLTVQIALIGISYLLSYGLMVLLGQILPNMRSVIFGFNFLLGVMSATIVKAVMNFLKKKNMIHREYSNDFLMTRASNFFFDLMVVAGIAAIRLSALENYWGIVLIMGVAGLFSTYFYNLFIAKKLFPDYAQEQFLTMYGMLTGTASTGVILLREIDGDFKTPASDNMVYQNFPAIVFGFPMMLLATLAPVKPYLTFIIFVAFFIVMNIILFRSFIFRKKK